MNNDLPFKTWKYEEQTKIKHKVFADYFDKWVKILGKAHPLNYFDCFGGIGAYKENDEIYFGSPILAAELIKKNETNLQRDVCMVIIDKDKNNFENIDKIAGTVILREEISNGRIFMHSMVIIGVFSICLIILPRIKSCHILKSLYHISALWIHLLLDRTWEDSHTLFWRILAQISLD